MILHNSYVQQSRPAPQLDVPYVPTKPAVVNGMLKLANLKKGDVLYDLGCGDGRIDKVKFVNANLFNTDLSKATVITMYLRPTDLHGKDYVTKLILKCCAVLSNLNGTTATILYLEHDRKKPHLRTCVHRCEHLCSGPCTIHRYQSA